MDSGKSFVICNRRYLSRYSVDSVTGYFLTDKTDCIIIIIIIVN